MNTHIATLYCELHTQSVFPGRSHLKHLPMHLDSPNKSLFPRKYPHVGTTNIKEKRRAIVYGAPIFQLFIGLFVYSI
jgi:hypothetical protein